jgi:hypothetical protein
MSTFVFLFTCASFACHGVPLHGNGIYYQTKTACHRAAQQHAARHRISLGRYEVENDR